MPEQWQWDWRMTERGPACKEVAWVTASKGRAVWTGWVSDVDGAWCSVHSRPYLAKLLGQAPRTDRVPCSTSETRFCVTGQGLSARVIG